MNIREDEYNREVSHVNKGPYLVRYYVLYSLFIKYI